MRTTGLLPIEQEAMEASVRQFKAAREDVIQELTEFFESAVADRPQLTPVWHKYPQGDHSFCDDIAVRAKHVQSFVTGDRLETDATMQDNIKALLIRTITWLVWRRVVEEQTGVLSVMYDSYSTPSSEILEASAAVAEKALLELDTSKAPTSTIPERPPDTTEPAPKTSRGLLGRYRRPPKLHPPDVDTNVEPATTNTGVRKLFGKR